VISLKKSKSEGQFKVAAARPCVWRERFTLFRDGKERGLAGGAGAGRSEHFWRRTPGRGAALRRVEERKDCRRAVEKPREGDGGQTLEGAKKSGNSSDGTLRKRGKSGATK